MTTRLTAIAVALLLVAGSAAAADWKPADNPLMTRWAKDISPDRVHPEYPRPQMVRKDWLNLNGLWQYAIAAEGEKPPFGKELDGRILVPFPIESALSGVKKRADRLWYRRLVTVPAGWKGKRVLLHFQAVDHDAVVYAGGTKVREHSGGYDAFTVDVTDTLTPGEACELIVGVHDPTGRGPFPRGKQVDKPRGIWYTPTTGIWQTVWLEPVAGPHIRSLRIVPDVDKGEVRITVDASKAGERTSFRAVSGEMRSQPGSGPHELVMKVPDAKLWSPETPHLYDLTVTMSAGGEAVDEVGSYFGMRKVSIGTDEKGFRRILLNGKFVFQIGFLDQGFWPDGLYTAPTDEALKYDIEVTKKLGMNMARKHVKIEPARWYYWCDKLGLLVWQDMPSGNTVGDRKQFQTELTRLVEGMGNHPSIIMWVIFNEGWGQKKDEPADTKLHVDLVRSLDPTRLICNASGWTDHACGDIMDVHRYPGPGAPKPEKVRAGVLGEFGGLGLGIDGHTWAQKTWGYRGMADKQQLTSRYVKLLRGVYKHVEEDGLSAAVYTQTSDVETECNGLMTYDRAIIKPDVEQIAAANRGEFPPEPVLRFVAPTSQKEAVEWRYTTNKPADGWTKPTFDDSSWVLGKGGFGEPSTPGSAVRTKWKTNDIWLRRTFVLPAAELTDPVLVMHHDEDAEVYINGVRAVARTGYISEYEPFGISPKAKAALKKGKNVFAVHCKQTRGGQYIDVGLAEQIPPPKKN